MPLESLIYCLKVRREISYKIMEEASRETIRKAQITTYAKKLPIEILRLKIELF